MEAHNVPYIYINNYNFIPTGLLCRVITSKKSTMEHLFYSYLSDNELTSKFATHKYLTISLNNNSSLIKVPVPPSALPL